MQNTGADSTFSQTAQIYQTKTGVDPLSQLQETALRSSLQEGNALEAYKTMQRMIPFNKVFSPDPMLSQMFRFTVAAVLYSRISVNYAGLNQNIAHSIIESYTNKLHDCADAEAIHSLEYTLVTTFVEMIKVGRANYGDGHSTIKKAVCYILENLDKNLALGDVASAVGLSVSRLTHLFSEKCGISVGQYIRMEKIIAAKNMLLSTQLSIADISAQLGYSSQSHFSSAFKAQAGVTPMEYRSAQLQNVAPLTD